MGNHAYLHVAGVVAFLLLAAVSLCAAAGPTFDQIKSRLTLNSDKTLVVKNFTDAWIRSLDKRGEPIVYTRANRADFDYIGMPIGGICAGQVYLGGDGKLWCWDIFNDKGFRDVRGVSAYKDPYRRSEPDKKAHHQLNQGFVLRLTVGGKTVTKTLDRDGFKDITFRGEYPMGFVTYGDKDFGVKIELEALRVRILRPARLHRLRPADSAGRLPGGVHQRGRVGHVLAEAICRQPERGHRSEVRQAHGEVAGV